MQGLPMMPGLAGLPNLAGLPGMPPGGIPGLQGLGRPPSLFAKSTGGLPPQIPGLGAIPKALGAGFMQAGLIRPGQLPAAVQANLMKAAAGLPPAALGLTGSVSKAGPAAPLSKAAMQGILPPAIPAAADASAPCTVYVGRISAEISDDFVRHLLEKCGKISKWNRAADPNTAKLTSFGFCDFEEPQGVWRALAFLHEQQLCDKRLLVKCEEKAKQTIEVWKTALREVLNKKRKEDGKDDAAKEPLTDEQLEEELRKESKGVVEDITRLLKEKNKGFPELKDGEDAKDEAGAKVDQSGEKEEAKAGDAEQKGDDKENRDNGDRKDDNRRGDGRDDRGRQRSRSREKKRTPSEEDRYQKDLDRRARAITKYYRVSRRERDREYRVKDRDRDIDKEYQHRIREFERGEDKRITNMKRELRDLEPPPEPSERDIRKFIERDLDYGRHDSDDRDWKRHREARASKRQREHEKDEEDKAEEEREVEDVRRKKEEQDQKQRKEAIEAKRKAREEAEAERKRQLAEEKALQEEERRKEEEELDRKREEEKKKQEAERKKQCEAAAAKLLQQVSAAVQEEMRNMSSDSALKVATGKGPGSTPVTALFRAGEEPLDANGQPRKHKPLTRLDGGGGEVKLRDDEMRRLIQQVPTDKAKAFAFKIDWDLVAVHNITEKKLRPWVKKKVVEYLGADESGMVEFILRKVSAGTTPEGLLAELEGFLDDEAENFMLKMWRMLIFEVLRVKMQ